MRTQLTPPLLARLPAATFNDIEAGPSYALTNYYSAAPWHAPAAAPLYQAPAPSWFQRAHTGIRRNWKYALASGLLLTTAVIVGASVGASLHKHTPAPQAGAGAGTSNGTTIANGTLGGGAGPTPWLFVQGNKIYQAPPAWNGLGTPPNGTLWRGRGANIQDTRGCSVCDSDLSVDEVKRRIDAMCAYNVNFMRLTLESPDTNSDLANDAAYFNDVQQIVAYIGTKPNTYVEVSLWLDPTFTPQGWPTPQTDTLLAKLVGAFANAPHVLIGVANEPQKNWDGTNDTVVWNAMNNAVAAVRTQEAAQLGPPHLVAVQGTRSWAQDISYYVEHPLADSNVLYEVHVYDSQEAFQTQFITPAQTLPVLIGEFGPVSPMKLSDAQALMDAARGADIPHLAWNFHMNCGPNLLQNNLTPQNPCGTGAALVLNSEWGVPWAKGMAEPWS